MGISHLAIAVYNLIDINMFLEWMCGEWHPGFQRTPPVSSSLWAACFLGDEGDSEYEAVSTGDWKASHGIFLQGSMIIL